MAQVDVNIQTEVRPGRREQRPVVRKAQASREPRHLEHAWILAQV